jgi:D-sedoheptulose 7-phosphate isomerase
MGKNLQIALRKAVDDVAKAADTLRQPEGLAFIEKAAHLIVNCYRCKNKILIAGNGGSLCDAMHFAEELTGQFRHQRPALAAIALNDPGHMSCVGNDMGFDEIFARGVEALGSPNDLFIALTTSGNSQNILKAVLRAKMRGLQTIAFLGKTGGKMKGMCDLEWIVSGFPYSDRVQEAHMAAIHVIIELVEEELFATHETHAEAIARKA